MAIFIGLEFESHGNAKLMLTKSFRVSLPLLIFFYSAFVWSDNGGFPTPTDIKNMLFYVQRSLNKNTIIYQLNTNEKDEVNVEEPIKMYWINYAGKSDKEMLNYIQRKYAYGINIRMTDKDKKTFHFNFVSYKSQTLYLIKSPTDKKYHVLSYFNNKLMDIGRIYIHIDGGTFWYPKVKYIEISGKDFLKNEDMIEKIIP